MKKKIILFFFISLFVFILGACSNTKNKSETDHSKVNTEMKEEKPVSAERSIKPTSNTEQISQNEITITAQEREHTLTKGKKVTVWTFNGSVPGPEIRVQEGENVKIKLKNELPEPVTIHWHGLPISNHMDGIPGVTMNAVQPGKSFTYEFKATVPGTYWYHSHQNSVEQLDKGLYGSLIVEKKNDDKKYDEDYTLVLDEWMSSGMDMGSQSNQMSDMDHGEMTMNSGEDDNSDHSTGMKHDMSMYDIFTINGKSGNDISPLKVKKGDKVRLRLINAGFMSHKIHLHGHDFKVISTDGLELNDPGVIKDKLLPIAPGERYDIEFTANNPGKWNLECHGEMKGTKGMKALIQYEGFSGKDIDQPNEKETLPTIDLTSYGKKSKQEFTLDQSYDLEYTMNLNTISEKNELKYTINGKTFPDTKNLAVKNGDLVKVKMFNRSKNDDHPMHLHGHFFQVLSKNGTPIQGSPIIKDSINLKPGDEYVVAFKADNPGNWMFHCHDLHHASAGMVTEVKYKGFKSDFTSDPNADNKPE